jgi:SM-20-related protein
VVRLELHESKSEIEEHFGIELYDCEEPQFLRYRVGDFFVAHQDGNTGMLRLDQENRRISIVILLTASGAFIGGDLVLHDYRNKVFRKPFSGKRAGTLVAFRSETTHEVTPIISGERLSIACWYR